MQRSTDRIYTTHVGSLARPAALLDLMRAAGAGQPVDEAERAEAERLAVADVVARQRAAGLDVISDGEQTKTGFFAYIGERLSGFEPRPDRDPLAGSSSPVRVAASRRRRSCAASWRPRTDGVRFPATYQHPFRPSGISGGSTSG
jgi:methionine synthase II (cobalamin-independent)